MPHEEGHPRLSARNAENRRRLSEYFSGFDPRNVDWEHSEIGFLLGLLDFRSSPVIPGFEDPETEARKRKAIEDDFRDAEGESQYPAARALLEYYAGRRNNARDTQGIPFDTVLAKSEGARALGLMGITNVEEYNIWLDKQGLFAVVESEDTQSISKFAQLARGMEVAQPGEYIRPDQFPSPAGPNATLEARVEAILGPLGEGEFEAFLLIAQENGEIEADLTVEDFQLTNEAKEFASRYYENSQFTDPIDIYDDPQFIADRQLFLDLLEFEYIVSNPQYYDPTSVWEAQQLLENQEDLSGTVIDRTITALIDGVDPLRDPADKVITQKDWDYFISSVTSDYGVDVMSLAMRDMAKIEQEFRSSEFDNFLNFQALRLTDDMVGWVDETRDIQFGRDLVLDPLLENIIGGIQDPSLREEARTTLKTHLTHVRRSNQTASKIDLYNSLNTSDYMRVLESWLEDTVTSQEGGDEFLAELKVYGGETVLARLLTEKDIHRDQPRDFRDAEDFIEGLSDFGATLGFASSIDVNVENLTTVQFLNQVYGKQMAGMGSIVKTQFITAVTNALEFHPSIVNGQITSINIVEASKDVLNARTFHTMYEESIKSIILSPASGLSPDEADALITRLERGKGIVDPWKFLTNVESLDIDTNIFTAEGFVRALVSKLPELPPDISSSEQLDILLGDLLEVLPEADKVDARRDAQIILDNAIELAGPMSDDEILNSRDASNRTLKERIFDSIDDSLRLQFKNSEVMTALIDVVGGVREMHRMFPGEFTGISLDEMESLIINDPQRFLDAPGLENVGDLQGLIDKAKSIEEAEEQAEELTALRADAAFDQAMFDASPLGQRIIQDRRDQAAKALVAGTFDEEFLKALRMSVGPAGVQSIVSVFGPSLMAEFQASEAGQMLISPDAPSLEIPERFLGPQPANLIPVFDTVDGEQVQRTDDEGEFVFEQDPNKPTLPRELAPEFAVGGDRRAEFDLFNQEEAVRQQQGLQSAFFQRFTPQEVNRLRQQADLQRTRFQAPVARQRRTLTTGRSF